MKKIVDKNIGDRLKQIREEKGISANALEKLSGVNRATINRIEANKHSPSIGTLLKICDALDITIIQFFNESEDIFSDMNNLIDTAKKLSPKQRQKITEMIKSFIE
nr:helix-turn-helix transcriptional regulator [Fredinandcohnia onubensis]